MTKKCLICGKEFEKPYNCGLPKWKRRKFCSLDCRYKSQKGKKLPSGTGGRKTSVATKMGLRFIINCAFCGTKKVLLKSRKNKSGNYFCNHSCHAKYKFRGDNHPRWKEKGNVEVNCAQCGKKIIRKRCYVKKSENLFCSMNCRGDYLSENNRGKNHPRWKEGVYRNNRFLETEGYEEWRMGVYKRDHFACQDCKKHCRKDDIVAHHIKPYSEYPDLRTEIDNGITLCRSCHKKRHKEIGYKARFKKLTLQEV